MDTQNQLLMDYLDLYFEKHPKNFKILMDIVNQQSTVSLRVLDHFVTNYAPENNIVINDEFNVHKEYKLKLLSYKKIRFDPFCRKFKTLYVYDHFTKLNTPQDEETKKELFTSCGQLCFFKWCFENNIIKYVEKHLEKIEGDMKTKGSIPKNKRKKVSVAASRTMNKSSNIKHVITFH